ncbi:unnamed protein product [Cuscuta campestris]|uniref:Replication protein A OB domain-containing protein n=1 Tax=Cuscuta campestris TaxID=132261 RepID=A0A484LWB9_9ASTE|nr:unnamed protein product [Cuscuta campestris]
MRQDYILTDVVGRVCCEGEIEEKHIQDRKVPCLMLELEDVRNDKVRLTLWGECTVQYMEQKKAVEGSIIAGVFTSTMVKEFMSSPTLSSTTATKVFLNIDIDEVLALKNNCEKDSTIKPLIFQKPVINRDTILAGLRNISEILRIASTDFEAGSSFYCHAGHASD